MPKPSAQSVSAPVSRLRWLYPIALACVVVIASGRSQVAAPPVGHIDKIAHFAIFGLLATLVARCPGVHRFRYAILAASIFGIADEFRQSFTPGRFVEIADWVADTAGAALAVTLYAFWPWYRRVLETPLRLRRRRSAPTANAAEASASVIVTPAVTTAAEQSASAS
jgi:VanZ family protein